MRVKAAQKTEKKAKEQEVFLGVKGNAQVRRQHKLPGCAYSAAAALCASCQTRQLPCTNHAARPLQLLGMKGADLETDIWKIRLQLMKPVTWIPLIWGERRGRRWLAS